ncbi:MAG: hypothetical protein LBN74_05380 [Prevotella sp.]|jgi:hypothetical protein|nr:hypothetical protein [Prevotella sp.]
MIDRIIPIKNRGMQCIQVDSPSHQYLIGKSYLPTHNSELAAAVDCYLLVETARSELRSMAVRLIDNKRPLCLMWQRIWFECALHLISE